MQCTWGVVYGRGLLSQCRPRSVSSDAAWQSCDGEAVNLWLVIPVALGASSMGIGLLIGAIVLACLRNSTPRSKAVASAWLYAISFPFWGAAFFSVILSYQCRTRARSPRSVIALGVLELFFFCLGFLTGFVMDSYYLANYMPYQIIYGAIHSFTAYIGAPMMAGSLILLGLPRVLITTCAVKDGDDVEARPLVGEY